MQKFIFLFLTNLIAGQLVAQNENKAVNANSIHRPKLVVGIVVDQMRWDYLYRYYDRYQADGGFKQLLNHGFSCENTFIPYTPTVTACGHASVYTGSVPAINGITGNDWWDYKKNEIVYCTGDDTAKTVGDNSEAGRMSPKNLLVTTIGDELNLATNFQSKVIGIALKDRGAILPAGHSAKGAFWYSSQSGDWITSSYYMNDLPRWVKDLNTKKMVDKYFSQDWKTLYPINTYVQSSPDEEPYETKPFGANAKGFPYNLKQYVGKGYGLLPVTPYGNSFTFDMATAAIAGEQLGKDTITDLLTISLSSPDYIGHTFGPNSVEAEDGFLRLDKDLGGFIQFLDNAVGKGEYLIFLTADHGVAHVPAFLKEHKIPAGSVVDKYIEDELNKILVNKFKVEKLAIGMINYQVYLDRTAITNARLDKDAVNKTVIDFLLKQPGISQAFALDELNTVTLNNTIKESVQNGYYQSRSGDVQVILQPQWIGGFLNKGSTHGVWNAYDAHIPLLWYGWNVRPGKSNRQVYMTDIAPTVAAMLHIQMPSGSIGNVIEEVTK